MSLSRARRIDYLLDQRKDVPYFDEEYVTPNFTPGRVREITGDDLMTNYMRSSIRGYDFLGDSLDDIDRKMVKAMPLTWRDKGAHEYFRRWDPMKQTHVRRLEENVSYSIQDVPNI